MSGRTNELLPVCKRDRVQKLWGLAEWSASPCDYQLSAIPREYVEIPLDAINPRRLPGNRIGNKLITTQAAIATAHESELGRAHVIMVGCRQGQVSSDVVPVGIQSVSGGLSLCLSRHRQTPGGQIGSLLCRGLL